MDLDIDVEEVMKEGERRKLKLKNRKIVLSDSKLLASD